MPILYVDAIPVRVDGRVTVTAIGLLLRVTGQGTITRGLVSARVMYQERGRSAVRRHLEKDLGPSGLCSGPASPQPVTVAEYFPTAGVIAFRDPRQHAVSLANVVPVDGDCPARQDALELTWLSPAKARADCLAAGITGGHGVLRQGLAHVGY